MAKVSYGLEVFGGVLPEDWTDQQARAFWVFQAYNSIKEEERKKEG